MLVLQVVFALETAALPKRLIIALDSIGYRDVRALQEGVDGTDSKGRGVRRQAFTDGYFPVSRLISTFPSASDVAWTEIFGGRALPGYQRTHYSIAANREISVNGITSTADYEHQVNWRVEDRTHFALSYVQPVKEFQYEVDQMVEHFFNTRSTGDNYYALLLSPDSAQHMGADILAMLCTLDERLQELRSRYRTREGRELEILILSDHANNHAGRATRVGIRKLLKQAGYRIRRSILEARDVVLPTAGLESWVEIHNAPGETERLVGLLSRLKGVDVVTGRLPGPELRVLVMNAQGHRATIDWDAVRNAFRYSASVGDPLEHLPLCSDLSRKGLLQADGFAPADDWMTETLAHRYPVALERTVRAHTRGALNPATILISLANDHMHAGWLVATSSRLLKSGGTHGALDDLNSTGILLSNFAPTRDTTTSRVAALYHGFPGLRDRHAEQEGAEWVSGAGQATITQVRGPVDWVGHRLPDEEVLLRIWTPRFGAGNLELPIQVSIRRVFAFRPAKIKRSDPEPREPPELRFTLGAPMAIPDSTSYERVYALPLGLKLEPLREYQVTGSVQTAGKPARLFRFKFFSDASGQPAPF